MAGLDRESNLLLEALAKIEADFQGAGRP